MEMKVLFIGNSYTYFNDMPKLFENLSRENGKDVQVFFCYLRRAQTV